MSFGSVQLNVSGDIWLITWPTHDICRFGWTNASYVYGLSLLSLHAKRALGVQAPYELYAKASAEIRD